MYTVWIWFDYENALKGNWVSYWLPCSFPRAQHVLRTEIKLWNTQVMKQGSEAIQSGFEEQGRRPKVQKSITGVSVVQQIRVLSFKNKIGTNLSAMHVSHLKYLASYPNPLHNF